MRFRAALALLFLFPVAAHAAATPELHTFTDTFGRTLAGEILEAGDTQAKIRRDDGQTFTLELAQLSEADATYVAQWRRAHQKFQLRIEADTFHQTGANRSTNAAAINESISAGYDLKVTNNASETVAGLRLEYNVFVVRPAGGRQGAGTASETRVKGSAALDPLKLKETATVRTQAVTYTKTVSTRGVASQTVELRGVWARVLFDGRLVAEFLSAEKLRAEGWQDIAPPGRGRRGGAGGPRGGG